MKQKTRHTPGEWKLSSSGFMYRGSFIQGKDRNSGDVNTLLQLCNEDPKKNDANASLICAAPDLLKTLREFYQYHECGVGQLTHLLDRAKIAIAKAEGGE